MKKYIVGGLESLFEDRAEFYLCSEADAVIAQKDDLLDSRAIDMAAIIAQCADKEEIIAKLALMVERCWKDEFHPDRSGPHHQRWLASRTKHELDSILGPQRDNK